jgi:RNA polymerase sigma-70 factor, ECF subfamily
MSPEPDSDEALLQRFQAGDRAAFAPLLRRHQTSIYNFVLRQVRSVSAAEDITQDVFVKVVRKASTFKHEARFRTWLFAIARNSCIDYLRKQKLRRHRSLDDTVGPDSSRSTLGERVPNKHPASSAERNVLGGDIGRKVTHAVESLPTEQREVFLLRQLGKVPFKEIAQMTGVSENTVKSRMRYALERLQKALADYEEYIRALG